MASSVVEVADPIIKALSQMLEKIGQIIACAVQHFVVFEQ